MKHFTSFQSYLSEMHREWIGNASGLTLPSRGNLWRIAAMITLLLTLACGNAWGVELFNLEVKASGSNVSVARQGGTLGLTTSNYLSSLSGGTATLENYNSSSGSTTLIATNSSQYQIYFAENTATLKLVLDNALAEGDVITFTSTSDNQISFGLNTTRVTTPATSSKSYTIPAKSSLIGETTIYLWRSSGSATYLKSLTITRPDPPTDWYVKGGWNSWGTTDNFKGSDTEITAKVNITTAGLYEFKIWEDSGGDGTWYGNGGNIGCNVGGWTFGTGDGNCKFFASETGEYTFTFNTSTKALSVTYPTAQGKYYYKNTGTWGSVAVYRYVSSINNGWPGAIITETETICGETYYVTYADPGTTLIFNNNNGGSQTGNMTASGNAGKYVSGTGSSWTAFIYNVTYNANGGTGSVPTDATDYSSGASVPVKDNTGNLAKDGYYFAGWNTKADGSGTTYVLGQTFPISSCTTLYAKWASVSCPDGSVTGTVFSITSPTGTVKVAKGESATITSSQATVSKGMATMVNGSGSDRNIINSNKFYFPAGEAVLRLNLGCALAKGDVISFTGADYILRITKVNSSSPGTNNYLDQPSASENCTIPAGSNLIGLKEVYIRRATSSTTNFTGVTITRPAGCNAPTALTGSSVTAGGVTLTVTDANDINDYEFYVSTSSTAPLAGATATHTVSDAKAKAITGLTCNTTYYAWARSKCGESSKSDWIALTGSTFTTSNTAPASAAVTPTNGWIYVPGEEIELTASATATTITSATTYTWYKGATLEAAKAAGAIQSAATAASGGDTYTIASCTASDAYKYWCEISNGVGYVSSASYDIKIYTFFLYDNSSSPIDSYTFDAIDRTNNKITVTIGLENTNYTYYFKVSDGLGTWYGHDDATITGSHAYYDGLNSTGANVGLTSSFADDYTIEYYYNSNNVVVTYPIHNQAADKVVYFDNTLTAIHADSIFIRIGHDANNKATGKFTLVPGTANLYVGKTTSFDNFHAWSIANNVGWTGSNTIYQPWYNSSESRNEPYGDYAITKQTDYQHYVVDDTISIIPSAEHNKEYGCQYYTVGKVSKMKTQTVTISSYSNGTITVNYTDTGNVARSFTSGSKTLAHTVKLTSITAVPATGYTIDDALTINGSAYAANHVVTGATTVAASFKPATYTVTLNTNSGTINSGNITEYTYLTGATLPTDVTRDGYRFQGWYAASDFSGDRVYTIGTSEFGNKAYWAKWAQLYSITDGEPSNGSLAITDGSSAITEAIEGETVYIVATPSSGYNFDAWNIYKTGTPATTITPAAATESTSFTMPAYAVTVDATFALEALTLTYNKGGATGDVPTTPAAGAIAYGTEITVPGKNTLAKSTDAFVGWLYNGTTLYVEGQKFTMTESVTLTAVWDSDCPDGGETLFSQNFNSATAVSQSLKEKDASLTINSSSENNIFGSTTTSQFTSLYARNNSGQVCDKGGLAINSSVTTDSKTLNYSGKFGYYAGDAKYNCHLVKTTDFAATAPTALKLATKVYYKQFSSGSNVTLSFAIGDSFSESEKPATSNVHSGFTIKGNTNAKFCQLGTSTNLSGTTVDSLVQDKYVDLVWVINNSGSSLTYTAPDGSSETVANDKFDIWVGKNKKVDEAPATTAAKTLQNLYIGDWDASKKFEFIMDSIVVTDLSPSGSCKFNVSFANMTGFSGSTTLPSTITGAPAGIKIAQPEDPEADGYEFGGWYKEATCVNAWDFENDDVSADVTLYAKWCATHTIAWVVNGETYTTGSPTTSANDCDGITTMPTAPADNTLGCANSFRGWSATNLYGEATNTQPADLFVTSADAPAITADKTFYAVFGTATDKEYVGTVLWSENWTGESNNATPLSPTAGGSVVYGDATISYVWTDGSGSSAGTSKVTNDNNSLASKPDAMLGKKGTGDGAAGGYLTVSGIPVGGAKTITVQYIKNDKTIDVSYYLDDEYVNHAGVTSATSHSFDIDCSGASTLKLKFEATTGNNVRIDNIVVKIKEDGATNYRCICPTMTVTPKLVTASTPIFITSAASKTVRSQDSLQIIGSGLTKNATLSLSSPASKFVLKSRTNSDLTTDETGAINTYGYIYYTPGEGDTSDGLDNNANFTVTDGTNSETVSQALIGRHLPTDFVIAAKNGDKWYALPANMGQGDAAANRAPVEITVDNSSLPTTALTPEANVYSLEAVPTAVHERDSGDYVILLMHGKNNYPLYGNPSNAQVGSSAKYVINNLDKNYWWALTQKTTSITNAKDATYNMSVANGNTSNPLKIWLNAGGASVPYWGLYSSGSNIITEIRLIPWLENYKVTFADGNITTTHTTWPDDIESVISGEKIDEPTDPTIEESYTFDGWYKEAECINEWDFKNDAVVEDVTLYAKWVGVDYNITYHLNGASWVNEGEATYTSGVGYTLPVAGDMSNVGYTFNGWYANSDLSTGGVVTAIGISEYGDKEFWAKWTENTYTVTYDKNGGSGSDMSSTVGHYVTLSNNAYTAPSGKTFIEWNTLSTGLGSSYNEGDEIELTADLTLYAIWGKSVGTINWTVTKIDSKLYRGGGGYTIKAEIDDASWDASDADSSKLVLTASEGVVLRNIAKSINASGKAQITANFDITTDVNANATKITFTLNVPENNGYAPLADDHDENLDNCTGGKVEVRFLSSNKNDAGDNFADMSTSSNTTQLVGDGFAKLIAIGSAGLNLANNKIGYRHDGRLDVVFKLTGTTTLDILFNANATGKTFELYSFSSAKDLSDIATSDYSSKTKVTSGITVTGAAFEQGKSKSTSAGAGSVSSGTVTLTTSGGIKATYASLASGYYVYHVSSSGNEGYLYGFDADAGGGGGGAVSPTLTWDTDLSGGVAAETGDADFTHTVTQNKNSLGAITYSSSNTSVVTVNATTGKVHIVGGGSATITATMEESGCYEEATASYDITVTDNCDDVPGTIEVVDLGCSGIQMTVTGHTGEGAGATYQWYKDDAEIDGATNDNYTATAAGSYYVIVTNTGEGHCSMASTNTVTVTAKETATATKIVDEWYVKNGRRTPDIALVQTENADNFQVKSGSTVIWDTKESVTTGFAGCSFYLGTNGIIYLMGQKPDGSEPSDLTAGDETLTFIASSCGGSASVDIKIHKQAATDYKTVAFVVDGTKEGAWDAVTSGHADGTMLYEYLDSVGSAAGERKFMLYERNIYKTTNEDTLRQHYSQFDAILITDDPNTRTVPDGIKGDDAYKTKGYVNAMGALIDVRPILTMEAYVSALANWKAKGIDGNPSSPNPRQYAMKLDCKNHAIFVGIDPSSTNVEVEDIDGVEYWTVAMVDSTKSPYSGVAYNVDTKDKPALQGFSASDVSGLMLLGEISDGALYAGVERQEEAAARLLLLGLNNKALPNALTPEGKKIIENTISYLIETDMEKVDDCSNYFTGAAGTTDWNTAENWSKRIVPNSPYVKARILKPCVLSGLATKVSRVDIATSGKSYNLGGGECSGSLTVDPTGTLIVGDAIRSAVAPYFNTGDLMPTQATDLTINTSADNQACVILNNDKGDTEATVNLYSLGRKDANYQYQYFAIPMESLPVNPAFANETHGGTKIYTYVWEEGTSSWTRRKYYDDLYAFEGLGITTNTTSGHMAYTMAGNLASTAERDITLTYDGAGNNIIGNSYTAPINIASLVTAFASDESVVKTVYIYCAGRDEVTGTGASGSTETAGQWLAIPMEAAAYEAWGGLKVIPSMQAFLIQVTAETGMTLDYKAMVRSNKAGYNEKLRAPQRFADEQVISLTRLRVADTQTHTDLYLFEAEQFSDAFDNGWEATYMEGDGRSAKLCAETEIGQMAVAALEEIEGTVLNFAPGQEMTYTFTFFGAGNGYYLNDLKLRTATLISEENSYEFTYEEGDTNRFYISRTPINTPAINTGTDDTRDRVKARKILYNNKLYILLNGHVYSAEGAIVK